MTDLLRWCLEFACAAVLAAIGGIGLAISMWTAGITREGESNGDG